MKQETTTKTSYHIPVGPIHPALKEPVHFEFEIEGERIKEVDVKLGHVHRAVEWASRKRNPVQVLYLAERLFKFYILQKESVEYALIVIQLLLHSQLKALQK
jgi:Ni,Fe-hydrogenase III large subunit